MLAPLPNDDSGKLGLFYGIEQAAWATDANVIFWTCGSDLFRTDAATGATVKLRDGCVNNRYEYVAAAPDASFVIVTKYYQRRIGYDSLEVQSTAWRIAGDGSSEQRLPVR